MSRTERSVPWDRRHFIGVGVGAFVVAAMPFTLVRRQIVARRSVPMMGTLAEITAIHREERAAQHAIDLAIGELRRIERMMTRFTTTSEIGRANAGAGRDGVRVSAETGAVIARALEWAQSSEGRFDPAIGAVVELWDVSARHEPPPAAAVRSLAARALWRKVDLSTDASGAVVRFEDPAVRLDLGAIAKGHAVDRAVAALRDAGVRNALVNVGGDLFALGLAPDGRPWRVGIRSPHDGRAVAATLDVSDQAVATSGDYAQFFRWRGGRYHHLMDPQTAGPRRGGSPSLTVQADCCLDADAAATAAFGLGRNAAARVVRPLLPSALVIPLD